MRNTYTSRKKSVARILIAVFFGIFSTSTNKILLDDQLKENNTKLSTTPHTYDNLQKTTNATPTAPQLQTISRNHPLSLVPRNFRKKALTEHISSSHKYPQSPFTHIIAQQP